jgi:hypothetical protein
MLTHPVFNQLWSSKCQPKHRVFFWLLLHGKLNTGEHLRRRHMALDSYICENCIMQKIESVYHLFLRYKFAERCWRSIGVLPPRISCPQRVVRKQTRQIQHVCSLDITILMAWSIWKCRNGWIFYNIPPTVEGCRKFLGDELRLLSFRLRPHIADNPVLLMQSMHL